ncbi:hypothetical protein PATY110618_17640 [Paenibacillus typhae]|uniref:Uncharacterized protein n=1 Tax=Paenibacillus typhae TaxID=1174501 RepID=A0A1G9BHN5_9BACL|nr:hypothetical protein SAMN05216192_14028 [Paenibacillus typhae]
MSGFEIRLALFPENMRKSGRYSLYLPIPTSYLPPVLHVGTSSSFTPACILNSLSAIPAICLPASFSSKKNHDRLGGHSPFNPFICC